MRIIYEMICMQCTQSAGTMESEDKTDKRSDKGQLDERGEMIEIEPFGGAGGVTWQPSCETELIFYWIRNLVFANAYVRTSNLIWLFLENIPIGWD